MRRPVSWSAAQKEMRITFRAHHPPQRPGRSGQGLVEFALVGGLFFFLIFGVVNGGLFLFGRSAIEHAASVGMQTLAGEGTCTTSTGICVSPPAGCPSANADIVSICRMDAAGLTGTALMTVSQVDIWRVREQNGAPVSTCSSNGTGSGTSPCLDYTCSSSGAGPGTGTLPCENVYTATGTSSQDYWPVGIRNVSSGDADFAELVIHFSYQLAGMPSGTVISMVTTNVFRLEPQHL